MPKPLSHDLRVRVLATVAEGLTYPAAAERFRVSVDSIVEWRKLEREKGTPERRAMGGDTRSRRIEAERDTILGVLAENPNLTLEELRRALEARGLVFSRGAVRNFLKRRGIAVRKQGRPRAKRPAGRRSAAIRTP